MDTLLVQKYTSSMNEYIYNHHSSSAPRNLNGYDPDHQTDHYTQFPESYSNDSNESIPPPPPPPPVDESPPDCSYGVSSEVDFLQQPDHFDAVLKYLNQMLMEEDDLQHRPCMLNECLALQVEAAEKSLYDVLVDKHAPTPTEQRAFAIDQNGVESPVDYFAGICCSEDISSSSNFSATLDHLFQSNLQLFGSTNNSYDVEQLLGPGGSPENNASIQNLRSSSSGGPFWELSGEDKGQVTQFFQGNDLLENSTNGFRGKRSSNREGDDRAEEARSNKQQASFVDGLDHSEMFDKALLGDIRSFHEALPASEKKRSNGGRPRGKKKDSIKEVVDLRSLLTQCAQAMTNSNSGNAHELLKKIRKHSCPLGDSTQRLAHYFANAIEARLAGTGAELFRAFGTRRISAAQTIKSYYTYIKACPFHRMSNKLGNSSIKELAIGRKKIHIIDFGILYGFQWPCFIQGLSLRSGGPPELRITGIDFPQPGFRPAERIEETGVRLANYCKRFNVPFKYNAVAKKWEDIHIEELKIERDEMVVVNCMYRLRNVPDETVVESSPRDAVLNLIKKINPAMFVHGVLNGTYNAPFLLTRFREALFHFSTLFDMFDTNAPRGDEDRLLFEQEVFGRETMNVIACEGMGRVERPETYKQWQSRTVRAGLKQLPLYPHIVKEVKAKVKSSYHKDFLVDEDSNWMLQGWKGRVLYALSLWKPAEDR